MQCVHTLSKDSHASLANLHSHMQQQCIFQPTLCRDKDAGHAYCYRLVGYIKTHRYVATVLKGMIGYWKSLT